MYKDYMLKTDTARKIYASVKALPIVDYHCQKPLKKGDFSNQPKGK